VWRAVGHALGVTSWSTRRRVIYVVGSIGLMTGFGAFAGAGLLSRLARNAGHALAESDYALAATTGALIVGALTAWFLAVLLRMWARSIHFDADFPGASVWRISVNYVSPFGFSGMRALVVNYAGIEIWRERARVCGFRAPWSEVGAFSIVPPKNAVSSYDAYQVAVTLNDVLVTFAVFQQSRRGATFMDEYDLKQTMLVTLRERRVRACP
jgi:hypothetical protein